MATTFWLKGCRRCGGDLHEEADVGGTFVMCLQCGHEVTREEEQALRSGRPVAAVKLAA